MGTAINRTVERTGAESQGPLEALASYVERAYQAELLRIRRYGGDRGRLSRLHERRRAYREAIAARDRARWGTAPRQAPLPKAA